jgi:predicted nucleotidyltransferase
VPGNISGIHAEKACVIHVACIIGNDGGEMNERLAAILAELRRRFDVLYGERLIRMVLFGSQARGDAESGSDIDVLVVLREPLSPCQEIERTLDAVANISLDFNEVVSCVFVSEEQFEREHSPLLMNVRREGVAI